MPTVSLFIPCTVDLLLPPIGQSTAAVLEHLGCRLIYHEEQTCCGLMSYNIGFRKESKHLAKHFIRVFENDDFIVSPSGSCVSMVKHRYVQLFEDEPDWQTRARAIAPRVFELSQFIVDQLGVTAIGGHYPAAVAYHESCSTLNGLGVSAQPKALIASTQETRLVELKGADICCGFGGTFANSFGDISTALVAQKVQYFMESGADVLVMCDPGCLLNIQGYLSRHHPQYSAMHLADFLYHSLEKGAS